MRTLPNSSGQRNRRSLGVVATVLFSTLICQSAFALTDYVFISVNGDTTRSTMVQGDTVFWGSNCDIGATLTWQIWLDININMQIDSLVDRQIASFTIADGDTSSYDGPGDTDPVPDGWYISPPMILGVAPGSYVFKATDHTDNSTAHRTLSCLPLSSPPNIFQGRVAMEGYPAPDSIHLRNIWVEAGLQDGGFQIWSGLTDENGLYQINIGDAGTGLLFRIDPAEMPGYITPSSQARIASGIIDSINFVYLAPTDSLYGEIKDQNGALITTPVYGYCSPRFGGPQEKDFQSAEGAYVVYFSPSEFGQWSAGLNPDDLIPSYLNPNSFDFDNSSIHSQRHDFVCYVADALIYARVTELGGNPLHRYLVAAQSGNLQNWTYAVSDTGTQNFVTLHISSLDPSGWNVTVGNWDNRYPIPPGYILEGGQTWNRHPGDTVALNFVFGKMVRDTVFLDPGDPTISWDSIWVHLSGNERMYGAIPDPNGVFTIYADTGTYMMGIFRPGYLTDPSSRTLHLVADTTGGLGFVINQAHCRVAGQLVNVPLPISYTAYIYAHTGSGDSGFSTWIPVDSLTGGYAFYLCDGSWTLDPPFIPNRVPPQPLSLTILEFPDSARTADLVYSDPSDVNGSNDRLPVGFELLQNYPNPFNSTTVIQYALPVGTHVRIEILNILGESVRTLVDQDSPAGTYSVKWDGTDAAGKSVATGIYLYRIKAGDFANASKMLLLK